MVKLTNDDNMDKIFGFKTNKDIFKDSVRYAFSSLETFIFLGFFAIILNFLEYATDKYLDLLPANPSIGLIALIIITLVFFIFESGYSFTIYHESLKGSTKPPLFKNIKEIFHHGIKDFTVILIYVILFLIGQYFVTYLPFGISIKVILVLIFNGLMILLMNIALMNLAYHDGNFSYAFNFKEIFGRLFKIGILRLLMILTSFEVFEALLVVTDFAHNFLLASITTFIFAPILLLISKRILILSTMTGKN